MACFTGCFSRKADPPTTGAIDLEEELSSIQNIRLYSYKELQIVSNDFSTVNKIGRGGFGSVYKGKLKDGTLVALKVLSVESSQGVREFLTEINTISAIQHENLVSLYGCCVEGGHRQIIISLPPLSISLMKTMICIVINASLEMVSESTEVMSPNAHSCQSSYLQKYN